MEQANVFDVTIIGAGPAGLYSAFYSGLREMKTKIIEFQPQLGGKIHVYPEKMIWDVGGLAPLPGAKLIEQLVQQGLTFSPEVVLNEKVTSIVKNSDGIFVLDTTSGTKHYSRTVIAASGRGILTPQKLQIEGAERFEVSNLNYTVKSLKQFKDKTVLVSGGGHSAVDWANELCPVAKQVYVVCRKDTMTGHEAQVNQLMNCDNSSCMLQQSISKLIASDNHERIERVQLTCLKTGEVSEIAVDEVVINHGYDWDKELIQNSRLDIRVAEDGYIEGSVLGASSVPGLFAAGDVLKHEGKLNLIAGAFQDAANAVNQAKLYIQPDASKIAMVSSHNEQFKERNRELVKQMMST
ncbi:NAD(P)/FAD-dependent oxidoreductase [Paenibacillus sp. F411]|uniref:Ferredoxin--NADP reductase n=1 Tax=Paenibacillus algicola TaxID=2565926 RepID=A0A4P8XS78_9BACL|nr:NAD(P)/FAD-dependent oxidoreductase [Paenibacillus algicola]MBO2944624.1 NAD(P)/FAD-dependent oxidoreductase [Paenibacillus sp. F411]QCT04741.1 pyridine nucleotide-disulfide oxidoreductase [Paenibacillus algicola]